MVNKISLGEDAAYPEHYDAELLQPIPRSISREKLENVKFSGVDLWNAYEVSWLDKAGKPQVAIAEFVFSADSPSIVESKSFKYYLNSFNESKFDSRNHVIETMRKDLSTVSGRPVEVCLFDLDSFSTTGEITGRCIDDCEISVDDYTPNTDMLVGDEENIVSETLYSHLLKSNCPVTGQPDWATIWLDYEGPAIGHEGLLQYIISYRRHQGFHESCVEQIFSDIQKKCMPRKLSVYARYTRRGGLDINPFRTNCEKVVPFRRLSRQ